MARDDTDADEYEAGDILKAMIIVATVYLLLGLMVDDCNADNQPQVFPSVAA